MHVSKLSMLLIKVLILEPGNKFKIFQERVSYNLRKYIFLIKLYKLRIVYLTLS